jgi:hypothetical protein
MSWEGKCRSWILIQEAWIGGVSTRRVDGLAQAMGLSGISKKAASKLCKDIDERVSEFLSPLAESFKQFSWRLRRFFSREGRYCLRRCPEQAV